MFKEYKNIKNMDDFMEKQRQIYDTVFQNWYDRNLFENIKQTTKLYLKDNKNYHEKLDENINKVIENYNDNKEEFGERMPVSAVASFMQDQRNAMLKEIRDQNLKEIDNLRKNL